MLYILQRSGSAMSCGSYPTNLSGAMVMAVIAGTIGMQKFKT